MAMFFVLLEWLLSRSVWKYRRLSSTLLSLDHVSTSSLGCPNACQRDAHSSCLVQLLQNVGSSGNERINASIR